MFTFMRHLERIVKVKKPAKQKRYGGIKTCLSTIGYSVRVKAPFICSGSTPHTFNCLNRPVRVSNNSRDGFVSDSDIETGPAVTLHS
jgi:hypothetical protein